ncbi:MAG: PIN domain-containing protein [Candidatus Omnitrophica bacterium]|nr:PIN domain-containing protein [Candidatus Omnitrophota bacterium]
MKRNDELFFDTSAFVKYYNKEPTGTKAVTFWIESHKKDKKRANRLSLFLPDICITETFLVFYTKRYTDKSKRINDDKFLTMKTNFTYDLEKRKYNICSITRKDIIKTYEIFDHARDIYLEYNEERDFLSCIDVLIVGMAANFKKRHKDFFLVTCDLAMAKVAERLSIAVLDPNNYQTFPDRLKPS